MIDTDIGLGDYVQNQQTNTEGYVTDIADHLTGCTRVGVRARSNDASEHHETKFYYPDELTIVADPQGVESGDGTIPEDPRVEPGHIVADEVTGIRGLVGIVTYNQFNCPQACVYPETDDGYATDSEWVDIPRLTVDGDEYVGEYGNSDDDPQSTGAMGASKPNESLTGDRL